MSNTATVSIEEEKRRAIAEIDARAAKQKEHQSKLGQLNKAVTTAEAALGEFESKKQFLHARKAELQDQLLQLWPKQTPDLALQPNISPLQCVAECYGMLLAIDAAFEDTPRVKRHLDQQLHVAKQALADFQRQR